MRIREACFPKPSLRSPLQTSGMALILCGLLACTGGGGSDVKTSSTPAPTASSLPSPTPTSTATPTPTPIQKVYGAQFVVSSTGDDQNPGTLDKPFRSLERARDAARSLIAKGITTGGIAIWLRGGIYERTTPLVLDGHDSGTSETDSIDWRGYPGEDVRLLAGRRFPASSFSLATNSSPIWNRLDASAQGKVIQLDLKAQGLSDFGTLTPHGWGTDAPAVLEVFVDAQPMWMARWPDINEHNMPEQDISGDKLTLYGTTTPTVAGTYTKYAVQDGVSAFKRDGLVDGQQYYLRRRSYDDGKGGTGVIWFLTQSSKEEWDNTTTPKWRCWQAKPTTFIPVETSGATGTPSALDPARINRGWAHTSDPITPTSFTSASDRPARWTQAKDAWVDGFWANSWAEFHIPIASVDPAARRVDLASAPPHFGILPHQPWMAYNLVEEITQPGEWYLDRASGLLYLWPPDDFTNRSEIVVSVAPTLISVASAKHIHFQDLTLEAARKTLFTSSKSSGIELRNLILRNSGSVGASIHGTDSRISHCAVYGIGRAGISLLGGDRSTLTPGNNRVEDCEIHHIGRTQISGAVGIEIADCGNTVEHNLIHHAPRGAISYRGNEHLIAFNELHSLCLASSDSGAIYAPGDWGARGVKIRFNYIHNIQNDLGSPDVHGIYLDETNAGALVESNLLCGVAGYAFKINGGRDHSIRHNVIANSGGVLFASDWGLRQLNTPSLTPLLQARLQNLIDLGYQQEPWRTRYPDCAAIPNLWAELIANNGRWIAPEGNELVGNYSYANKKWYSYDSFMRPDPVTAYFRKVEENLQATTTPFIDEAQGNLRLKPNSQVFTIPSFEDIPFDQIGIRR